MAELYQVNLVLQIATIFYLLSMLRDMLRKISTCIMNAFPNQKVTPI